MTKTVVIGGKKVRMRVTARIPYEYMEIFGEDMMKAQTNADILYHSRLAWLFARAGGEKVYDDLPADEAVKKWLDKFDDPWAIYTIAPELTILWLEANKTLSTPKKKRG